MTELDPQTGQRWPADPAVWKLRTWVERQAVNRCARAVFVTPTALRLHTERYPRASANHWALIPNGYDEEQFAAAERIVIPRAAGDHRLVLLHSGILYRAPDRDPSFFFSALAKLKKAGKISGANLKVVLRASGYEQDYLQLIRKQDIADVVFLEPAIPYREALAEMLGADGLLLFQGHDSNSAIPAKFYEYLRARRPIFAMADSEGDTVKALCDAGVGKIVPLDSADRIAAGLVEFLDQLHRNDASVASAVKVERYSRQFQALQLAELLDGVVAAPAL
jgi:glycosyltransferase involved in cell wall biosynthesis